MKANVLVPLVALLAIVHLASDVTAREPLGDLELLMEPLEVTADGARIGITLQAVVPLRDPRLTLRVSDGTPGAIAARPVDADRLLWRGPGAAGPVELGDLALGRGHVVRSTLDLTLPPGRYEVVATVQAQGEAGPLSTQAMVRVGVGVPDGEPEVREGAAEYLAVPGAEVRP